MSKARERLIEREVAFRLQDVDLQAPLPEDEYLLRHAAADTDSFTPDKANRDLSAPRLASFIETLKAHDFHGAIRCDFSDCQSKIDRGPIVTFNRVHGSRNYILFPLLPFYHNPEAFTFSNNPPDPIPYDQKEPTAFWRGSVSGFIRSGDKFSVLLGSGIDFLHGDAADQRHLERSSRVRLCRLAQQTSRIDAAFVQLEDMGLADHALLRKLSAPVVFKAAQFQYKYLIAASGNDVASSMPWMLNTNSVVLKETAPHQTYLDCHFRPWQHFVPVKRGFQDLIEKIDWCDANPAKCKDIVARANDRHAAICDANHRFETDRRVLTAFRWT